MTIMRIRKFHWLLVLISMILLSACSSTQTKTIPQNTLTMTDIYHATTQHDEASNNAMSVSDVRQQVATEHLPATSYVSYTRNANNEVTNLFKTLPNPQIPVYIYPHVAAVGNDDLPVPGYTTVFSLFAHDEYAMPSEQY